MRSAIIGRMLPTSREATIKLKNPRWEHIGQGSVVEAKLKFFDNELHEIHYKHNWWKRVWYTSRIGRQYWKRTE